MGQLAIPNLFAPVSQLRRSAIRTALNHEEAERDCIDWLMYVRGCSSEVVPYVKRLFSEFDRWEAWDRAKSLPTLCECDGWTLDDAELLGIYDHAITDYHVLWDRNWAIRMLVPKELVPKVWKCGYGGRPKFWDRDGNLLFQSVYCVDGHMLTSEERRKALTEEGAP